MNEYPFPDKTGSIEELHRDLVFNRIPAADLRKISDLAWETGVGAAETVLERYPENSIYEIVREAGLSIERIGKDNISGNLRYFSEYYSARKKIFLYTVAIENWASANRMSYEKAEELILGHEFFHHLECTSLGLTSKLYSVPWLRLGRMNIGKVTVRALSEIGAHGFSLHLFSRMKKGEYPVNAGGKGSLKNAVVNEFHGSSASRSRDIWENSRILKFLSGRWS